MENAKSLEQVAYYLVFWACFTLFLIGGTTVYCFCRGYDRASLNFYETTSPADLDKIMQSCDLKTTPRNQAR